MRRRHLLKAATIGPIAANELIRSGFTAVLAGRRDSEDRWRDRVDQYGRDYMEIGADSLQTRLAGDLVVLQQQLDSPTMWATAARALTTYGKTTKDPTEAIGWYDTARIAADRSDDLAVRVWVRGRAAIALAYEGAALPVAKRYADEAIALSDRPSLGRLQALMARAHVAAGRGDIGGAITADEDARRIFDLAASPDGEISDAAVPAWRMATFRSMLYARLGMVGPGEQAQTDADRLRPTPTASADPVRHPHRATPRPHDDQVRRSVRRARLRPPSLGNTARRPPLTDPWTGPTGGRESSPQANLNPAGRGHLLAYANWWRPASVSTCRASLAHVPSRPASALALPSCCLAKGVASSGRRSADQGQFVYFRWK